MTTGSNYSSDPFATGKLVLSSRIMSRMRDLNYHPPGDHHRHRDDRLPPHSLTCDQHATLSSFLFAILPNLMICPNDHLRE